MTNGEYFSPGQWFPCTLRILADIKSPLKNGAKIKFHTGTSEVVATVYLLQGNTITAVEVTESQCRNLFFDMDIKMRFGILSLIILLIFDFCDILHNRYYFRQK